MHPVIQVELSVFKTYHILEVWVFSQVQEVMIPLCYLDCFILSSISDPAYKNNFLKNAKRYLKTVVRQMSIRTGIVTLYHNVLKYWDT